MKRCSTCKKNKPESDYQKNRARKDGLHDKCRECQKEYFAGWRKKNPNYHKAWLKEKYSTEEGREVFRKRSREQYRKKRDNLN